MIAIGLAWLCSLTTAYQKFDLLIGDAQQKLVASEQFYTDALVVDIDDASLAQLQPHFGTWPYTRDVYALAIDYLTEHGARAVVLDIQLIDPRPKDDVLAQSLRRNKNAVLIASASPTSTPIDAAGVRSLANYSWDISADMPVIHWPTVLMPNATLTGKANEGQANAIGLGMVAVEEDADGVLRRIALFHDVSGVRLPAVSLAALGQGQTHGAAFEASGQRVLWKDHRWPIDAKGNVHLNFPKNANAVLNMPFLQIAEAALGVVHIDNAAGFFKDKVIFIGSTAHVSDRVTTPRGTMAGTQVLAITYESLKQSALLTPRNAQWDGVIMALTIAAILLATVLFWKQPMYAVMTVGWAMVCVYLANLILLSRQQESVLLFPLLMMLFSLTLAIGRYTRELNSSNASLEQQASHLAVANVELETAANTDALTGLLLRRALLARCDAEVERLRRTNNPLSLAILDLDHFKRVNDTYGHPAGDMVLRTFADIVRQSLRTIDVPARWGGEEFVVLLPETALDDAANVIERIRAGVEAYRFDGMPADFRMTVSVGLAQFEKHGNTIDELIASADAALYDAKKGGRNRIGLAN